MGSSGLFAFGFVFAIVLTFAFAAFPDLHWESILQLYVPSPL